MNTSAIKKQSSVCKSLYMVFQTWNWNHGEKKKKESNSIVSLLLMSAALPIAPFKCKHCL